MSLATPTSMVTDAAAKAAKELEKALAQTFGQRTQPHAR